MQISKLDLINSMPWINSTEIPSSTEFRKYMELVPKWNLIQGINF